MTTDITLAEETDFYVGIVDRLAAEPSAREFFRADPVKALKTWGVPDELAGEMLARMGKFTVTFSEEFDSKIVLCSSSGY